MKDVVKGLRQLGSKSTSYKYSNPSKAILETFPNKYPGVTYEVKFVFEEFTSLCPKTGQPDFATFVVTYSPKEKCIESKSLKLYFFAYRNYGSFMETITNKVCEDLVGVCEPEWLEVQGLFKARGGVVIEVRRRYEKAT